jgi:hypothetical protein
MKKREKILWYRLVLVPKGALDTVKYPVYKAETFSLGSLVPVEELGLMPVFIPYQRLVFQ